MYTKEEREGILWEFRQSGLSVPEACRRLPLFPTRANLYRWLRMEEAGELAATEMPDRAARMHCAHGEGSARFAARSRRVRGEAEVEGPEQTDWRESTPIPFTLPHAATAAPFRFLASNSSGLR